MRESEGERERELGLKRYKAIREEENKPETCRESKIRIVRDRIRNRELEKLCVCVCVYG